VVQKVDEILANTREISGRAMVVGRSIISGQGSAYGMMFCDLKPFHERNEKGQDINSVIKRLY
jgi:HAE1 family hydrophobic/amphiphilic exporter-1